MTTWASLSRRALLAVLAAAFCLFACAPALAFADDDDDEDESEEEDDDEELTDEEKEIIRCGSLINYNRKLKEK